MTVPLSTLTEGRTALRVRELHLHYDRKGDEGKKKP
jgi:hypothetical protein